MMIIITYYYYCAYFFFFCCKETKRQREKCTEPAEQKVKQRGRQVGAGGQAPTAWTEGGEKQNRGRAQKRKKIFFFFLVVAEGGGGGALRLQGDGGRTGF